MVRVSGVPYEVELNDALLDKKDYCPSHELPYQDMISILEHENRCLRARTERLEREIAEVNELLVIKNMEILKLREKQ